MIDLSEDVRVHGRRTEISTEIDSMDEHSIMSADSIEPTDTHDSARKPKTSNQYSPMKTLINKWNTPRTLSAEPDDADGKDFLSVSTASNRNQGRMVT